MATLDHSVGYWDDPSQVIWVHTPVRRLQGMDFYFIAEDTYGGWNDPTNYHMYEGRQSVAYRLDSDGSEHETPFRVPRDAAVYVGFMLTEDQAKFVGLL